jgi:hypothetical protein
MKPSRWQFERVLHTRIGTFFIWRRESRHGGVYVHTSDYKKPPLDAPCTVNRKEAENVARGSKRPEDVYVVLPDEYTDPYSDYSFDAEVGNTRFDATRRKANYYHRPTRRMRPMKVKSVKNTPTFSYVTLAYDGPPRSVKRRLGEYYHGEEEAT